MAGSRRGAVSLALCILLHAGVSRAQDPTPIQSETARAQMEEGMERLRRGDVRGALENFSAADALVHTPTTGYELGATEARLGRLIEARTRLLAVTRSPARPVEPPQFDEARMRAARLSDELADRIPALRVHVHGLGGSEVAELVVDGSAIPAEAIAAPVRVNPGHHEISVRAGGRQAHQGVDVGEREVRDVSCDLPQPSGASREAPQPSPAHGHVPVVAYVAFGAAAAAVALGATAGLIALSDRNTLDGVCHGGVCPDSLASDVRTAGTWADVSTASFIVAAVGAVAGTVIALVSRPAVTTSSWVRAASGRFDF